VVLLVILALLLVLSSAVGMMWVARDIDDYEPGEDEAKAALHAEHVASRIAEVDGLNSPMPEAELAVKEAAFPDMVYVPEGYYLKGRWQHDELGSASEPVEVLRFVHGYWIDRLEFRTESDSPRSFVTWDDAADLCLAQGKTLCTDNQWEKACKGPQQSVYSYGNEYAVENCPPTGLDPDDPYLGGANDRCVSGYGVMDMGGGCREWTSTRGGGRKITKDGWLPGEEQAGTRCAARKEESPVYSHQALSFRCCIDDDGSVSHE